MGQPGAVKLASAEALRLEEGGRIDCTSTLAVDVSSLARGTHARCIVFHPTRPLLAVGVGTCVGGYDLLTGCRVGRVDVRTPAVGMAFSRDGSLLVVATQEWHLVGVNSATWRSRVLAPYRAPRSAPLEGIMIAITSGSRPVIFFTRHGKDSVRMVIPGMEGRKQAEKLKWGLKLKLDVKKPVIGLAAHPKDQGIVALFGDGALRGYSLGQAGLVPTFTLPVDSLAGRVSLAACLLETHPHPFIPNAALLLYGTQNGGIMAFEIVGREEPRLLLRTRTPGGRAVIGMGIHQDSHTLLAFTTLADGGVKALGWQMFGLSPAAAAGANARALAEAASGAAASLDRAREGRIMLATIPVELPDLEPSPDGGVYTQGATLPGGGSTHHYLAPPAGGAAAALGSWQALWGATSGAYSDDGGANFLLGRVLAPVVSSVAVHGTLGVVAVRLAPPLALRQAPKIMTQQLGLISPAEASISRRTASIPLLRVMNDTQPAGYWPGGAVAPMNTALDFWQSAGVGAVGRLQFPCHLYYLGTSRVCKYGLASKTSGAFVTLPDSNRTGRRHRARYVVHSPKQHAWLVFFEATDPPTQAGTRRRSSAAAAAAAARGDDLDSDDPNAGAPDLPSNNPFLTASAAGAGAQAEVEEREEPAPAAAADPRVWEFCLVREGLSTSDQGAWFLPGKHGAFLGPKDEYFAILPAASNTVSFYLTAAFRGKSAPAFTIDLGSPSPAGPGLLAGPAALGAPREGAEAAAAKAKEEERKKKAAKEKEEREKEGGGEGAGEEGSGKGEVKKDDTPEVLKKLERREQEKGSDEEVDTMIPVIGIGSAYQPSAQHHGGGLRHTFASSSFSWQPTRGGGFVFSSGADLEGAARAATAAGPLSGGGVVMWHTAGGALAMAGLPAPPGGVQYAAGDDSDDPDGVDAHVAALAAPSMGELEPDHTLPLQPGERALAVSWQNLTPEPPLEPSRCAAALLTTRRLLLVAGDLRVIASVDASDPDGGGAGGVPHAITSFVWAGPALLYMTAAGQVMQLTWTGETHLVASVAAHPTPILAGALADSLLLLRPSQATGELEVATRAVNMLQPLVLGWCSLAASGLLPKLSSARAALQQVLSSFDTTTVTSDMLWTLLNSCCWDVAAALAANATDVDPSAKMAANAAAGRWPAVVSALLSEHERSVYFPRPAPHGSALHSKLLAGAAGAMMHGQFGAARDMLQAAGEWETALALAVCQGDFTGLRELAFPSASAPPAVPAAVAAASAGPTGATSGFTQEEEDDIFGLGALSAGFTGASVATTAAAAGFTGGVGSGGGAAGARTGGSSWARALSGLSDTEKGELSRLARTLISAHERNAGRMFGAVNAGVDWKLRPVMADSSFFSSATDWSFGGAGKLPAMETSAFNAPSQFVQDGEVGPIPRAEAATLGVYLGMSDLTDTSGGRPPADALSDAGASDIDQLFALGIGEGSFPGGGSASFTAGSGAVRRAGSAASSLDLAAGGGTPLPDDFFDLLGGEDDEERIRVRIKSQGDLAAQGSTAVGAAAGGEGSPSKGEGAAAAGGEGAAFASLDAVLAEDGVKPGSAARPPRSGPMGGPPMRPKVPKAPPPVPISDDDFFSALAPALAGSEGGMLSGTPGGGPGSGGPGGGSGAKGGGLAALSLGAPAPPTAAGGAGPQQQQSGAAGPRGGIRLAPPPPPSAAPAAAAAAAATAATAASSGAAGATELYLQGVSAMESGNWDTAESSFSGVLAALKRDPPSDARQQKTRSAAQYLAAVLLLRAAATDTGPRGARLYRYAAALKLDDRHVLALVKEAVVRNRHVGNYRYSAEQLTWLITQSLGKAPMQVMAQLQEDIDDCDRKGGRDSSVPPDERPEDVAGIVAAAEDAADVRDAIAPLVAAGA